jgi:hypothetical protein
MENPKRQEAIKKIDNAIRFAIQVGFEVVVASDEEGNSWNTLNPIDYAMFYSSEECKPNIIALGVYASIDEDEVMNEMKFCDECIEQITKNGDGEWESEDQLDGTELCFGCSAKKLERKNCVHDWEKDTMVCQKCGVAYYKVNNK